MTRICFFADGQSVHTQRWIRAMVQRGFQATLVTRRPWTEPGVEVIPVAEKSGYLNWFSRISEIRSIVNKVNPDIVHGHYITSYGFWAAASGRHPMVLTAWGSDILVTPKQSWLKSQLTGWTLRRADLITADSLDMLEEMKPYHPRAQLEQIQWGVDLELFQPATPAADGVFHIVSLRTWEPLYNIDVIISAFAELRRRRPGQKTHLHLLGDGYLGDSLRAQVEQLGLAKEVTFHGRLNEQGLVEVLQRSHVSVMVPSNDATAMSLLESMAVELPVIVSDLPANRQWVDEGGGFTVPVKDDAAIANALEQLLDDPARAAAMGRRNRAVVAERASRRHEMDRMADLYQKLLHRGR